MFQLYIINTRIAGRAFVRDLISHCITIVEFQLAVFDSYVRTYVRMYVHGSHEKGKEEEGFLSLSFDTRRPVDGVRRL